jgi:hypothetical protein
MPYHTRSHDVLTASTSASEEVKWQTLTAFDLEFIERRGSWEGRGEPARKWDGQRRLEVGCDTIRVARGSSLRLTSNLDDQ